MSVAITPISVQTRIARDFHSHSAEGHEERRSLRPNTRPKEVLGVVVHLIGLGLQGWRFGAVEHADGAKPRDRRPRRRSSTGRCPAARGGYAAWQRRNWPSACAG